MTQDRATILQPDGIDSDDWSALGSRPVWIGPANMPPPIGVQSILIGVDVDGTLACIATDAFDVLLTTAADAPAPWVIVPANMLDAYTETLAQAARDHPIAATLLAQTLRLTEALPFVQALEVESLAYSTLLAGAEFRGWCAAQSTRKISPPPPAELVSMTRADNHVTLTLNDPKRNNAMTAGMRDALYGALVNLLDDPTEPTVSLNGFGRCFSTGGHIPEFGSAQDLAKAHVVRTLHSCARVLYALGDRARVHLHGACIGSGLEVPTAAHYRTAAPNTWFQLPELRMGLIPGAGGTVSVSRAIGRHRTAWMVLSGKRVSAQQGLAMGLIHAIAAR